jgi:DNA-binding PadR family transcriptional regulator
MPTTPRFTRSPASLVVLNLLCERPRHPYALRVLIRERGIDNVVKIGGASIYDAMERLEKVGFIDASATTREGRRPERTVYTITEAGRDELQVWMAELLSEPVDEFPQFGAALAFVIGVGRQQTLELLKSRAARLESLIAANAKTLESVQSLPRIVLIEGEYMQALRNAELAWLRGIIDDIAAGRLWSHAEIETLLSLTSAADQDDYVIPPEIARVIEQRHRPQPGRPEGEDHG